MSSFRATLEELEDASLVIHVVDASHPLARQQIWSVQVLHYFSTLLLLYYFTTTVQVQTIIEELMLALRICRITTLLFMFINYYLFTHYCFANTHVQNTIEELMMTFTLITTLLLLPRY